MFYTYSRTNAIIWKMFKLSIVNLSSMDDFQIFSSVKDEKSKLDNLKNLTGDKVLLKKRNLFASI